MALQPYKDILEAAGKEPVWYDEAGVPRFCEFDPQRLNDIYATEAVLLEVACQACGAVYKVAMSRPRWFLEGGTFKTDTDALRRAVDAGSIHYGDPPCWKCAAGYTMNCEDLRVLEFFQRPHLIWERVQELERDLPDLVEWQARYSPTC